MELSELRTLQFVAPSGHTFTIREQNGEDEEILSNPIEMRTLLHLSRFISAIVVDTDATTNHKLSMKDALNLPLLDRYCILFKSRIFSLGEIIEFNYEWTKPNGTKNSVLYEEDLNNFLFENYGEVPSDDEMDSKPDAIPLYPDPAIVEGKEFTLDSGKKIRFKAATSNSEQYIFNLPENKRTRNSELVARDLMLEVEGKFEKVTNFRIFSVRDMNEIHKLVKIWDPAFLGLTEITNPDTNETEMYPIIGAPSFFFLME
jgi:hypothetical protein